MAGDGGSMTVGGRHIMARLVSQTSVPIAVVLVTLLATFLAGAAPRLLDSVSVDDLRATVSDPLPAQRNIRVERASLPIPGSAEDPFGNIRDQGQRFANTEFPPSVSTVVSGYTFVVDSPRFAIEPFPGESAPNPFDLFLEYRYQDRIEENSELVAGRLPEPQTPVAVLIGEGCPTTPAEISDLMERLEGGVSLPEGLDCALREVPVFEVAVTEQTLAALGVELDQTMMLRPDENDVLYFGVAGQDLDYRLAMRVSGVIELTDPELEFWYGDPTLHRPSIEENPDFRIIYATGLMAPADFASLAAATTPASWASVWRHFVDADAVAKADIELLQSDLRSLQNRFSVVASRPGDFRVLTQLGELLAGHEAQKSQTLAMLSLSIAGLFAVSLAALLLLGVLMTDRQRGSVVLTRNRGGSGAQLTMSRVYEAVLLVAVPAVVGYWIGKLVFATDNGLPSYRLVVAMALAAILMIVITGVGLFRRRLGSLQTERSNAPESSSRRVVWEVALLVVTVASVLVLRRRGLADDVAAEASFDLLLVLAPILIAAAGGVILLRLFPLIAATASRAVRRFRGAVGFFALKRVTGRRVSENLPLAVVVVCVAVAALSAVTANSISNGQEASSWQVVGADLSIEGFRPGAALPVSVDLSSLPADASALARVEDGAPVEEEGASAPSSVAVIAVESVAYRDLLRAGPLEVSFPDEMTDGVFSAGTADQPMPAIVSADWAAERGVQVGEHLDVDLGATEPVVEVRSIEATFPDVAPGGDFIVVDLAELQEMSEFDIPASVAYIRLSESHAADVADDITSTAPSAQVTSRYEWLEEVSSDPFVAWSTVVLTMVFWYAVTFAVAISVAGLALTAASRRRDLAYLRTMGLAPRQAARIVFVEQMPGVVVGTLGGVAAGILAAVLLAPMIALEGFTGHVLPAPLTVDWSEFAILAVAVIGAMTIAVGIFVVVSRRDDVGKTLRTGEEP